MGRQWLQAKREVAHLKKGQAVGKLVKEIMVAAKLGGAEPENNGRLAAAVEKARKLSVSRDVIERAIKKGAGIGDDKLSLTGVVFEGYAPHKVPVIVEVFTDNQNRTAPEIRMLFKSGQLVVGRQRQYPGWRHRGAFCNRAVRYPRGITMVKPKRLDRCYQ